MVTETIGKHLIIRLTGSLAIRSTVHLYRLHNDMNLLWTKRHDTQERGRDHNAGTYYPCNPIDVALRLVLALSSHLFADLLGRELWHNLPCRCHGDGQGHPVC